MSHDEALAELANVLNCLLEVAPSNLRQRLSRDASVAFKSLDELIQKSKPPHEVNNGG